VSVAIVDYGSGNLHSAAKAFERASREAGLSAPIRVSDDPAVLRAAARIVLPGVGAFADCMTQLAARPGVIAALEDAVIARGRPFLGICVGLQLLATRGFEHGSHRGLGWIAGEVVALDPADPALKVPHMGWNEIAPAAPDPATPTASGHALLEGLDAGTHFYFVHGYHLRCARAEDVLARVDYGGPVVAAVARGNIAGVQFHPEKSQAAGLRLIANFLRWTP